MPAAVRVRCPDDPLREDQVDDEKQDHTCCDEDLCCDCYADVGLAAGPDYAHYAGGDSCHAETEHHPGHYEFVAAALVNLEDCHVRNGPKDVEEEEDSSDGDIGREVWDTA